MLFARVPVETFRGSPQCHIWAIVMVNLLLCPAMAQDDRWTDLLENGKISSRWESTGNWQVEPNGVITLKPRPGEAGWRRFDAYLWSKERFAEFEIQFDYRLEREGNSGFYFHVGDKGRPVERGIEVQIFDSLPKSDSSKLTDHDSGGIIPGIPPTRIATKPAGQWNRFQIKVRRQSVTITLNGSLVNEVPLDHPKIKDRPHDGYVGFQDHGMPLSLRNVRIRKLQ